MNEMRTVTITNEHGAWDGIERRRVEKVMETLAALRSRGESIAEVAHDARNMVTALTIYCDLLEVPGVLGNGFAHYAQELRLVAAASLRLVEKLLALDACAAQKVRISNPSEIRTQSLAGANCPEGCSGAAIADQSCVRDGIEESVDDSVGRDGRMESRVAEHSGIRIEDRIRRGGLLPVLPVANLAAELLANRNLLAALAGPSIALTIETECGAQAVRLTAEDLTRLLVNLVKNAAEAMPRGGRIAISVREIEVAKGTAPCLALTIEDNGPGIPEEALEKIFVSGYTSRTKAATGISPQTHRGLGLAIVRSIVEGAGGRITAADRPQGGACFTLELPVRKTGVRE